MAKFARDPVAMMQRGAEGVRARRRVPHVNKRVVLLNGPGGARGVLPRAPTSSSVKKIATA
jgi:hypothetical protein